LPYLSALENAIVFKGALQMSRCTLLLLYYFSYDSFALWCTFWPQDFWLWQQLIITWIFVITLSISCSTTVTLFSAESRSFFSCLASVRIGSSCKNSGRILAIHWILSKTALHTNTTMKSLCTRTAQQAISHLFQKAALKVVIQWGESYQTCLFFNWVIILTHLLNVIWC